MSASRIDLADCGSPEKLVIEILKHEPDLPIPVPIEKLALQLGIAKIEKMDSDGFIGGLITNDTKSTGVILVKENMHPGRCRFTLGHELGHFLIPTHTPSHGDRFQCSIEDLQLLDPKVADTRKRWEAEANRFAGLLLVPPPIFRKDANKSKDPDLHDVLKLAKRYDVSKEVAGRCYTDYRHEPVAFIVTHNGRVLRYYRRKNDFPFISVPWGAPVPQRSLLMRRRHNVSEISEIDEIDAGVWIDATWGKRAPTLYEQVHIQQQGYALILLTLEPTDEDEEEDDSNWNRR
jgi:Zn-dependent peptidase ImmA (M78 family)